VSLRIETSFSGEVAVLRCRGRIVIRDEASALSEIVSLLLKDHPHVVLNLAAVESVDSGGLGAMVVLHMWARGCGRTMKYCCISEPVRHLLTLTKLDSLFEVHATEEDAIAACRDRAA
jgi:anti-sigma B factor antagonist